MKKFYSLLAVAAIASMSVANAVEFDDSQYFTLNLLEQKQDASKVTIEVGAHIEKADVALVEFYIQNPDGVKILKDEDEETYVAIEDYKEGWALTSKKFNSSNSENKSSLKQEGRDMLVILNHPDPEQRHFATGDIKFCKFTIDASALKIGEGEGPNKNNFYVEIPGSDVIQVLISMVSGDTTYPKTAVRQKLAVQEDGTITGIETIRTNDVNSAKKGIYNMMGQKVRVAEPGQVYIINGQKVIPTETISE